MNPLSLPVLPRASRPFTAAATAPPKPTGLASARTVVHRRRRLSAATSAVSREAPRADEAPSTPPSASAEGQSFDWLDQWYPFAPVGELDPGAPNGKTVLGLNVVAWYDRAGASAGEWRVFDDACPHRVAPLSEGRVDGKGRLQCAYHGWCFDGAGACRFIPQAPALGPPVHTNSRACVASYPCVAQNRILWFYPRTEPEFKDVLQRKRPPFFDELDDPSYFTVFGMRDFPFGYDILTENLVDPAHVQYAHWGLVPSFPSGGDPGRVEHDREGGDPIKIKIEQPNIDGFLSRMEGGDIKFEAPCTIHGTNHRRVSVDGEVAPWLMLVLFCVPVSPQRSRLIWLLPRNGGVWLHKITPRWYSHMFTNLVLDSDLCLLHIQESKLAAVGLDNWHQACYVPTSSDCMIVAFRNWFRKYCKNQIVWAKPQADYQLPPIQSKDKLMDRYWSHVVQCRSCSAALKAMGMLEVALQVASVAAIGFLGVASGTTTLATSVVHKAAAVVVAVLCFAASRWLAGFIEKNFHFEDYLHAYK